MRIEVRNGRGGEVRGGGEGVDFGLMAGWLDEG